MYHRIYEADHSEILQTNIILRISSVSLREHQLKCRENLFWLTVSEALVHGCLVLLPTSCGSSVHNSMSL